MQAEKTDKYTPLIYNNISTYFVYKKSESTTKKSFIQKDLL